MTHQRCGRHAIHGAGGRGARNLTTFTKRYATGHYKLGFIACSYKLLVSNRETRQVKQRTITISEFREAINYQNIHTIYAYICIFQRTSIHTESPTTNFICRATQNQKSGKRIPIVFKPPGMNRKGPISKLARV